MGAVVHRVIHHFSTVSVEKDDQSLFFGTLGCRDALPVNRQTTKKTTKERFQMSQIQRTLSIIKPDGVEKNVIGDVLSRFEKAGLEIAAMKMIHLTPEEAGGFYIVHKERPFYGELREYMSSGPIIVVVLEGPDAISANREIMGATNPADADPGTIRADHAESIERNIVHGSDSQESADYEIPYFFSAIELHG
jgi:nucleoside-diphosphate kinase